MASKSKSRRRVFRASCILAALIVAGSSFAWFSSKDEVTNRLSAAANYGVAIAEDFQPPEKFLPGQTVNKDVGAVNTGNVDAFVRMWLGGQMRIVKEDTTAEVKDDAKDGPISGLETVTDASKKSVGLDYYKGGVYYKTLSKDKVNNPNDTEAHSDTLSEETNQPARYSEVQAVQAGGVLVYAPANAQYHWTLEQATELPVYTPASGTESESGYVPANTTMTNLEKGTVVGNSKSGADGVTKLAPASDEDSNYYGAIDASTFTPETSGLYIFRRNVKDTVGGTVNTYEYSGYYYDANLETYFALHTDTGANGNSDYVLPTGSVGDNSTADPTKDQVLPVTVGAGAVFLYTATETLKNTDDLSWAYRPKADAKTYTIYTSETESPDTVYVSGGKYYTDAALSSEIEKPASWETSYTAGSTVTVPANPDRMVVSYGSGDEAISMNINLANIGADSEKWTVIGSGEATTFYYNNDVEEGDTTTKLVDSVELSKDTQNGAYLLFDFDLDVFMESMQVTMDENGKEKTTPVNSWAATKNGTASPNDVNTGAKPSGEDDAATYTGTNEIATVGWTALS